MHISVKLCIHSSIRELNSLGPLKTLLFLINAFSVQKNWTFSRNWNKLTELYVHIDNSIASAP